MIQRDRDPGFAFEPKDRLFVACELGPQDLDRHVATHRGLVSPIHRPHPAGPNLFLDAKLLEQNGTHKRIRYLLVGNQQAAVVWAILGSATELRTAAKANLPHVGKLPWKQPGRSIWQGVIQFPPPTHVWLLASLPCA